jgi:phosphoglycolate phosphatase-like HAD superfamily hydrolase
MKKFTKIYLDMDGVLCDFEKQYLKIFGKTAKEARDQKEFSPNWKRFVEGRNFEKLDWFPGGQELLSYVRSTKLPVEILSSSGGEKFHGEVTVQKIHWLKKHGIAYKANIVPGRKKKKEYATPHVILIDDTEDVIEDFNRAGGVGILHKDSGKTIETLKKLLEKH